MDDIYLRLVEEQKNPGVSQRIEAQEAFNTIHSEMLKNSLSKIEALEKSINRLWCLGMGLTAGLALRVLTMYF